MEVTELRTAIVQGRVDGGLKRGGQVDTFQGSPLQSVTATVCPSMIACGKEKGLESPGSRKKRELGSKLSFPLPAFNGRNLDTITWNVLQMGKLEITQN